MTTITIGYPSQTDNITIQPNVTQVINVNAYSDTAESFVVIPSNNVISSNTMGSTIKTIDNTTKYISAMVS